MFNVNGNLETKIDVSLGNTQSESQKTDLSKNNQLVFKIPQKSYFEKLKIVIQTEFPLNYVANREIQLDAMKKSPLTYPIIEENHRE